MSYLRGLLLFFGLLAIASYALAQASAEARSALHYVKGAADDYKPECDVTITKTPAGTHYECKMFQGQDSTTVAVTLSAEGRLLSASSALEIAGAAKPKVVSVGWRGGDSLDVKRASGTEFLKVSGEPIITTTPDWSDVWQLLQKYDRKKGGKQQFAGAWVHPVEQPLAVTFSIEQIDNKETIMMQDRKVRLNRYLVRLRPGDYLVWTDSAGTIIKIVKNQPKSPAVVLEGYQEATAELGPR